MAFPLFNLWNTGLETTLASPTPTTTTPSPKSGPKNEQNENSLERAGRIPLKRLRNFFFLVNSNHPKHFCSTNCQVNLITFWQILSVTCSKQK